MVYCMPNVFLLSLSSYKIVLANHVSRGGDAGCIVRNTKKIQPSHLACRCPLCPWRCSLTWECRPLSSGPSCLLRCWACGTNVKSLVSSLPSALSPCPFTVVCQEKPKAIFLGNFSQLWHFSCVTLAESLAFQGFSSHLQWLDASSIPPSCEIMWLVFLAFSILLGFC